MAEKKKEQAKNSIWYKVMPNQKYRIWRKDFNGKTFYNIRVSQKQYDDSVKYYYIPVTFKKGVEVDNETDIKIIKAIENIRENTNVEEKVRPYFGVMSYMITEFEIVERQEQIEKQALNEYNSTLDENEIEIDDSFLD